MTRFLARPGTENEGANDRDPPGDQVADDVLRRGSPSVQVPDDKWDASTEIEVCLRWITMQVHSTGVSDNQVRVPDDVL